MALVACSSPHDQAPAPTKQDVPAAMPKDAAVDAVAAAVDAAAPAPPKKVFVHGAGRCGECHEKMFDEWEGSAHARAVSSPIFKAAAAAANDAACDGCHAPLAKALPRAEIPSEGVTCDVCHTLRDPKPAATGAGFRLAIDDMVKFGPRCDLKDHYFHRMGCSPEHRESALCGSCHWWERKGVPVFTEYLDWQVGPAASKGTTCQACHMPTETAVLATGSPRRTGVPHHGLLGIAGDLRTRALGLEVSVRDDQGALVVNVTLTNVNGGHAVPAGLPERRVLVRVRVRDAAGAEGEHEQRALGRVLVDGAGVEVPFWKATRVGSDTRIGPGASWHETFTFHPAGPGKVEVEVVHRALSDAAATALGITDVAELPMTSAKVAFTKGTALKTVTIKPRPPGKRAR